MHTSNARNKHYILSSKIIILALFISINSFGQVFLSKSREINLPNADNRIISYGYSIGLFSSYYRVEYNDRFQNDEFSNTAAINSLNTASFSIGPIGSVKLFQFLKLQSKIRFSFYNNKLEFVNVDGSIQTMSVNSTRVEFPFLLKYVSKRRGNTRIYIIGGINPSYRISAKNNEEQIDNIILIKPFNFSLEYGFGVDIYFPLFKFSPEFRFSQGFSNILSDIDPNNPVTRGLKGLYLNSISLYIQVGD